MQLPAAFINRMKTQLGDDFPAYLTAMERPSRRALRVNTLKTDREALTALLGEPLEPCGIIPEGLFVPDGFRPGKHPLHAAGLFYMQEPSAQLPASLLQVQPHETVLDLCAAPGGKSGQLAGYLQNTGLLVANEITASRATVLMRTLERLGTRNAIVTNMHPDALCRALEGMFDAVLVDAPCSGEGMFRREKQAIADWSEAHVEMCATRQRAILDSAVLAVRRGGRLVYSTCTFASAENEKNVEWFLDAHPDFSLVSMQQLYPHTSGGEGQFAAVFMRDGDAGSFGLVEPKEKPLPVWEAFAKETMTVLPNRAARKLPDGRVFLLPDRIPQNMDKLRVLNAGVLAGEIVEDRHGGRFIPSHALFMAYEKAAFRNAVEVDNAGAEAFLAGELIRYDGGKGFMPVCYHGHPLGFGKLTDSTLKNHLPKGLRIR